jgi:GntR family transcriptional regulator
MTERGMLFGMLFAVDFKLGKPVYLQIVDQVKAAAASGALQPGDSLPSIRPVAEQLRVNRNTIAKAYNELEKQGVIETVVGKGCFLKNHQSSPLTKDARLELLTRDIDQAAIQAHHLRIDRDEFIKLATTRFDLLAQQRAEAEMD